VKAISRALADAARQLERRSDTARLDAELLMAEALHIDRDRLILSPPDRPVPQRFWDMLERRRQGEPVAYITGRRAFWNIELHLGPGVLVPRPDSEVLIAAAIEHFAGTDGPRRILDLGTGPGTLLLAALDIWPVAAGAFLRGRQRSASRLRGEDETGARELGRRIARNVRPDPV
jgi:release factor glutamine methyltransferase